MSLVMLTTLSGCTPDNRTKIQFWTGFGANVNEVLEPLLDRFEKNNPDVKVEYEVKGGYDNLMEAIVSSISNQKYPHIANGYPDHFATYAVSGTILDLNTASYIKHPEQGVDIDQYLPNYMNENMELIPGAITGLPFNKSTEVMVVNQTFFDVAKKLDPTVKVPETWQELKTMGALIKKIATDNHWPGRLIKHNGEAIEAPEKPTQDQIDALIPQIAFDMTSLKPYKDKDGNMITPEFIPFSWDSTANFFITILRQWGAQYTEQQSLQKGYMVFNEPANKTKTLAALNFFRELYTEKIVGLPTTFGETQYSSKPFKEGKLVLTVSSSAGISNNMPAGTTNYPFEVSVAKIPYNAENPNDKYVISQGTNLALFRRGELKDDKTKVERNAAWRLLRYLTYEVNHEFGKGTSYFPVTDGTKLVEDETDQRYLDYKLYKEFLAKEESDKTERAIRDTAIVQASGYQEKDAEGVQIWKQFVDPGFLGSSAIRNEVSFVMGQIFAGTPPEEAIQRVLEKLKDNVKS